MWKALKSGEDSIRLQIRIARSDYERLKKLTDAHNTVADLLRPLILRFIEQNARD